MVAVAHGLPTKKIALVGAFVLVVMTLVSFQPSIRVGFIGDDWEDVAKAAQTPLGEYLRFYFDPTTQVRWYRPLYGLAVLAQYSFFRASPEGYHVVQILLHLANVLWLYRIVSRLSRRWRLAWLAAAVFAGLPALGEAVFWVAVHDPLAMFFYLAAVWFWVIFLQTDKRAYYLAALVASILALLAKEASVFLSVTLFLIDRLVVAEKISWRDLFRRYAAFVIVFFFYLLLEWRVQSTSHFTNQWGYGIGSHMVINLLHYVAVMMFPWGVDEPVRAIGFAIAVSVLLLAGARARSRLLAFLGIQVVISIIPVTGFPAMFFYPRYVYSAAMAWGVLLALSIERVWESLGNRKLRIALASTSVGLLVLLNSAVTIQAADAKAEEARQWRVPYRDISQQHPTFPPDTYLYFVDFPYPYILRNLRGMFYLRYASNVTVWSNDAEWGGWDENRFANLRAHKNAWVYYLDQDKRRREIAVQPDATFQSSLAFPLDYAVPLRLEGFEVTAARLNRGDDLAVLLYWRARGYMDKDYAVFVHLIDARGEIVLRADAPPRGGRAPTSKWSPGKMIVDAHILTIPPDLPRGTYRLEIGMYYLPTLERLVFLDANGTGLADRVAIEMFTIAE